MRGEYLELFNSDYVYPIDVGKTFEVVEQKSGGKGVCFFRSDVPGVFIKAKDAAPIVWALKNKKCAEAAFALFSEDGSVSLHVVEMKSGLGPSEFSKVLDQIRGMYLSALSALAILRAPEPKRVVAYVAYKRDKISHPAQPIFNKTLVGGRMPAGIREWRSKSVSLPHGVKADIVVGQREGNDFDFGTVA